MTIPRSSTRLAILIVLLAVLFVGLAGCSSEPEPTATPPPAPTSTPAAPEPTAALDAAVPPAVATAFVEWGPTCLNGVYPPEAPQLEDVDTASYVDGASGLKYIIINEGSGETPSTDWEVDVLYTGWLDNGCIFDSSYTRSDPTVFPVNQVIPGWQLTITEMKVGERRRVEIPPDLAYGIEGSPPVIPANATLTFDVILNGGTSRDRADAIATRQAEDLFAIATREASASSPENAEFAPIATDYFIDVEGFLDAIPTGERACMTAYAGGEEALQSVFSAQQRAPREAFVDEIDSCLSETTRKNIIVGRIIVVGGNFTDETLSCMEQSLPNPTLKPLFGIFNDPSISRDWITTHFCMDSEERVIFDQGLYAADPTREGREAGFTYVDVQECMVGKLGNAYFEPADQPDPGDQAALNRYYEGFSTFLVADLSCKGNDESWPIQDDLTITADSAQCIIDDIGADKFGAAILDRSWSPTAEEHLTIASGFISCGIDTDFLELPGGTPTLNVETLSCITSELSNTPDPTEASLTAFTELGRRNRPNAGDLGLFIFSAQSCDIAVPGLSQDRILSDEETLCIVGKMDQSVYTQGRADVFAEFLNALTKAEECR